MSFARRFASLLALLAVVTMSVWSTGCADSSANAVKGKAGATSKGSEKAPAKGAEAGSSTGGGTSVPGEK